MTTRPTGGGARTPAPQPDYDPPPRRRRGYQRESLGEAMTKSFIRSIAASLGRILVRMLSKRIR